ncbi:hypothetical protein ENSA5_16720 [Enhygromyxa salina]|uniref:Uncharacterized protein n=1 Tax=Enhygromyxa salina TaxID=215803 RepID=A0A2S9YE20_9BACT|nr:TAXI family TRAP transporter solute-binding subunit [Enhygromyxa salina]PRQ03364.1 hypothetical protein ENSA5_16720 [Enhygromyxa salina]
MSRARTWLRALAVLLVLVSASVVATASARAWAQAPEPSSELRFGAGSKSGSFTKTAEAIGGAVDPGLGFEVVHTNGSCDNVRRLARGELDAALVKYDVAAEAFGVAVAGAAASTRPPESAPATVAEAEASAAAALTSAALFSAGRPPAIATVVAFAASEAAGVLAGNSGWMCDLTAAELDGVELQLVAAIDESAAHVLIRRPVRLDNLAAVGQRPIFVGQRGSGSMETSKIILGAAGLSLDDVNSVDIKNKAAMTAMEQGELLLMLRTTEVPNAPIARLLDTGMAGLNALPSSVVERLIDGFPYYRVCKIGADSYPGLENDVPTVCVSTVVLTARREGEDALDNEQVIGLIDGLGRLRDEGKFERLRWHGFAASTPVPLHPGAKLRDLDARAREPGQVRFGASSKTGSFTRTANALALALDEIDAEMDFEVRHTGGSCDNVRKLARGEVDAALVQYAVAAEAWTAAAAAREQAAAGAAATELEGESGWMCGLETAELEGVELQLVAAIDDSAVHLIVRRPVRLDDFGELGERPIFVGQQGSGSMETSKVILGAAGLTLDDVNSLDISNKASMEAMERGELLMMLRTTKIGDAKISSLVSTGVAGLNALPSSMIERLIDGFPYYRVCQIDAQSYPGVGFGIPTVCVSTVVLTARREGEEALDEDQVRSLIEGLRWLEDNPQDKVAVELRWRGFAEREPIPLHPGASWVERRDFGIYWTKILVAAALGFGLLVLLRRFLRRKGLLGNPLGGNLEGQLSNPLVPFVGFLLIVGSATLVVYTLEHDSNARVRTLNDSFWEMNMFATGNFDSESLKTSTARFIGAAATIAGLGLLAWFTAALTSILSQDQMRLFRRMRNHIVILNFREEMIQLIRVLRSPGPQRQRSIHVVVSDALPPRVRQQLTRVRGLTIYEQNPEVPEELVELRLPRAARVIVLQGSYHPLRIARAVHHACVRLDPQARAETMKRAQLGLAPSVQSPTLAGDAVEGRGAAVPVTLVEADEGDSDGLFDPFSRWLVPVPARGLADAWLANACLDPAFGEFFNDIVTFRDDNSELYTVELPEALHGKTWRDLRRLLFTVQTPSKAGIVPIGIYRGHRGKLAYAEGDVEGSSPQAELRRRLRVNPPLDMAVGPGDRLLAFAEDEADLRKVLKSRRS